MMLERMLFLLSQILAETKTNVLDKLLQTPHCLWALTSLSLCAHSIRSDFGLSAKNLELEGNIFVENSLSYTP